MIVKKTDVYTKWFEKLRDVRAKARIAIRVKRLANGNAGSVNSVGEGVSELKIDEGKGYRVYYKQAGKELILLLIGGDKASQDKDIQRAKAMAKKLGV